MLSTIYCRYVFDVETGRSFFLTAVIYTNANGVLNDDRYEYEFADRTLADLAEVLGRALWQIPDSSTTLSSPFDCTPSSLWTICAKPLTIPTFSESSVDTEEVEESKLPANDRTHAVEQQITELSLTSSAENLFLSLQSPVQRVSQQTSSTIVGPEEGSYRDTIMEQSSSMCSSTLQPSAVKSVQIDTTGLPPTGGQRCNPSGNALPMPLTQVSTIEVVSTSPFAKIFKNSMKPCYRYFVDE